jgi:hypothetical protein
LADPEAFGFFPLPWPWIKPRACENQQYSGKLKTSPTNRHCYFHERIITHHHPQIKHDFHKFFKNSESFGMKIHIFDFHIDICPSFYKIATRYGHLLFLQNKKFFLIFFKK